MRCPKCGARSRILRSREPRIPFITAIITKRRRRCNECGFRFTTVEMEWATIRELKTYPLKLAQLARKMLRVVETYGLNDISRISTPRPHKVMKTYNRKVRATDP
jgi:transcriptional regulator NrdR family protein